MLPSGSYPDGRGRILACPGPGQDNGLNYAVRGTSSRPTTSGSKSAPSWPNTPPRPASPSRRHESLAGVRHRPRRHHPRRDHTPHLRPETPMTALRDRLFSRLMIDPSGCVLWTGAVNSGGYGTLLSDGRNPPPPRGMYAIVSGPIPHGLP